MNLEEIRQDIIEQLSRTSQNLSSIWWNSYFKGIYGKDTVSIEAILKKVKMDYRYNNILSIIMSSILIIYSLLKDFNIIDFWNINKPGFLSILTILLLVNTFRLYKVKIILENRIELLRLLDKIDRK